MDTEPTPRSSPQSTTHLTLEDSSSAANPAATFPFLKYELVDPITLTASPAGTAVVRYSIAGTPLSLAPHSPSWFSRNVHELELLARQIPPRLQIEPASPDPLPIHLYGRQASEVSSSVNRSFDCDSFQSQSIDDSVPPTPRTSNSSVTLNISHKRLSLLSINRTYSRGSPSVNRLSTILRYRQSVAESRKSIQSFITCASIVFPDDKVDPLDSVPEKVWSSLYDFGVQVTDNHSIVSLIFSFSSTRLLQTRNPIGSQ